MLLLLQHSDFHTIVSGFPSYWTCKSYDCYWKSLKDINLCAQGQLQKLLRQISVSKVSTENVLHCITKCPPAATVVLYFYCGSATLVTCLTHTKQGQRAFCINSITGWEWCRDPEPYKSKFQMLSLKYTIKLTCSCNHASMSLIMVV